MNNDVLVHHGIPGMKWGIRRYQRRDGSRTSAGKRRRYKKFDLRYASGKLHSKIRSARKVSAKVSAKVDSGLNKTKKVSESIYSIQKKMSIGKDSSDRILARGTEFARIQREPSYIKGRAFYAVYRKKDVNLYSGIYGAQLKNGRGRSNADSLNRDVYQVKLTNSKGLRMPSNEKAADITARLVKRDAGFRNELQKTIDGSRKKFMRPMQKELFRDASNVMKKSPRKWSPEEKRKVYEALNLSLTNHDKHEVAVQKKFYKEMKQHGYGALSDINDKKYSSFHAKDPVIVFDTSSIRLQSVTKLSSKQINSMLYRENPKRVARDTMATASAYVDRFATSSIRDIKKYAGDTFKEYTKR